MELISAAKRGELLKLSRLLGSNVNPNFRNGNYSATKDIAPQRELYCGECLQKVTKRESPALARLVLGKTVTCDWPDHKGVDALFDHTTDICCCATAPTSSSSSSKSRCTWIVCIDCFTAATLAFKSARQICKYQEGYTALIASASEGNLECVKMLLTHKADVNLSDPDGFTPLMAAICANKLDTIKLLLRHGANVDAVTMIGMSVLHLACELGNIEIVQLILDYGPDLSVRDMGGNTVLHAGASGGDVAVIQCLLEKGLSPKISNSAGDTPLHLLSRQASTETVRILVQYGAVYNPQGIRSYPSIVKEALEEDKSRPEKQLPQISPPGKRRGSSSTHVPVIFVKPIVNNNGELNAIDFTDENVEKVKLKPQLQTEDDEMDSRYFARALSQATNLHKSETGQDLPVCRYSTDDPHGAPLTSSLSKSAKEPKETAFLYDSRNRHLASPPDGSLPSVNSLGSLPRLTSSPSFSSKAYAGSSATSPGGLLGKDSVVVDIPRAYTRPAARTQTEKAAGSPKAKDNEAMKNNLSPPLPLMRFNATDEKEVTAAKTITGERIRSIPNITEACTIRRSVPLCDPIQSRKISKWFIKRSFKELNWKQVESYGNHFGASISEDAAKPDLFEILVYESLLYTESPSERNRRDAARIPEEQIFHDRYEKLCASLLTAKDGSVGLGNSVNSSSTGLNSLAYSASSRDTYSQQGIISNYGSNSNLCNLTAATASIPCHTPSLKFDGEFESGNLEKAVRVIGRESLLIPKPGDSAVDLDSPGPVDQEYDLTLRKDINTDGNIQWYYFSASVGSSGTVTARSASSTCSSHASCSALNSSGQTTPSRAQTPALNGQGMSSVQFPLRVRFNIVNMQKKDSLYNYGMRPATYSENQLQGEDWVHRGEDVCYYRSGITIVKGAKGKSDKRKITLQYLYTLTFTYTFDRPDTVFFAHTFPYTYTDLKLSLCRMEQKYHHSGFFHQRTLCDTLAGNSCDIISITERSTGLIESKNKPAIILTARVHPGESNSSFMMQGFLDFITSNRMEAVKLRKTFVFHIIPMLNPDGVIHGNYRCSLAATDLNRRYALPFPSLHPTILAKKKFINSTAQNRNILLYLDLHGHSKLKNAFLYGCDITMQSDRITKQLVNSMSADEIVQRRIFSRVFPKVLSTVSNCADGGYFSYKDCAYVVDRSKYGTGRVVCWREMHIPASYTIEASFCGNGDNKECKLLKRVTEQSSSGYGATTNVSKTALSSGANKNMRKSSSVMGLPRDQSNGSDGSVGIAFASDSGKIHMSGGKRHAVLDTDTGGGTCSDGSDDEQEQLGPNSKSNARSHSSKGKSSKLSKKSSKGLRRSSTTPNLHKGRDSGADDETALKILLDRYDEFIHYRKEDLLNMGRDIGVAIFHYANLSHSSVENELKIATKLDAEEKARAHRANFMEDSCDLVNTPAVSTKKKRGGKKKPPVGKGSVRPQSAKTSRRSHDSHIGHVKSAAWQGDANFAVDEVVEVSEGSGGDVFESDLDLDGVESLIPPLEDPLTVGDPDSAAGGIADQQTNGEDQLDLDDDSGEGSGSDSGSVELGDKVSSDPVSQADLSKMLREYHQSNVALLEADMVGRSLLKPAVFSTSALEKVMHDYPNEFLSESSTENVGLRMKCEYIVRRSLRCAGDIVLTNQTLKQHQAAYQSHDEEEALSIDGSDSNPSVDNVPVAKMLKSVKRLKDRGRLVQALKSAAVRRKKKELDLARRIEKQTAKKLELQATEAKRIQDEANAALVAQEAAAQASANAQQFAERLMRDKVAARRKSSIFQSAPKHAPLYRLAPEDVKPAPQVLPMKIVNFKDHDNTVVPSYHPGATSVDPLQRARSRSDLSDSPNPNCNFAKSSVSADAAQHNLALSMSSLTSAVNRLYFTPLEELSDSATVSATTGSMRHNAQLTYQQQQGETRQSGSPRSAAAAVRPTIHSMADLLTASAASGEIISSRERERVNSKLMQSEAQYSSSPYVGAGDARDRNYVGATICDSAGSAAAGTARQRPKSGNPTSRRKLY